MAPTASTSSAAGEIKWEFGLRRAQLPGSQIGQLVEGDLADESTF